jgi:hypothetical protein
MRQRGIRKDAATLDLVGVHRRKRVPREAAAEARRRSDGQRLAARHLRRGVEPRCQVVAALEEPLLRRHDLRLVGDVGLHGFVERLHRLLGVQRIAEEVEALDLALVRLIRKRRRGRLGVGRRERIFGIGRRRRGRAACRRLRFEYCIGRLGRWPLTFDGGHRERHQ